MACIPSISPQDGAIIQAIETIVDVGGQAASDAQHKEDTERENELTVGDYTMSLGGDGGDDDDTK